ncbi:sulfurtransferase [Facklamia miroungae]|uniref:Sulfurtransferase n=1 Tax=Facklamia miroungae TaxID=120956 RepID=A0A1G7QMZ3_9LACT|nr:rhodanese-like domain-containing protein [Facklamia miroungae]NKZ29000.1 sulfurtransferase [Facklamia miroungae]SDF99858.1 thiosulfate/3-mercaptopyruvate sulfurtransferase [Facklamia miroungae]
MKKIFSWLTVSFLFIGIIQPTVVINAEDNSEETTAEVQNNEKYPVDPTKQVYVDAEWVKDVLEGNSTIEKYVLAEVTWGEADASPDYLKKHIPGAIHINTDSIEEGPIWNLKSADAIEKALLNYGVDKDTTLILYGPDTGVDRVAYAALYTGVESVKILDGGLAIWEAAGFETEEGKVEPQTVEEFGVEVPANPDFLLSLEDTVDALANNDNFRLVSLRSENEWLGIESGYSYIPKAGEPKGAVWGRPLLKGSGQANISDMEDYKNEDGTNKNFDEIVAFWEKEGFNVDNDLAFYCGTGWRSSLPFLMMYERGLEATMFDGGWNEWQMNDDLEVQIGDPKSDSVEYKTVGDLDAGKETE